MRWKATAVIAGVIIVLFVVSSLTKLSYGITRSSDAANSTFSSHSGISYTGKMKTYSRIAVVKPQDRCPNNRLRDRIAEELLDGLSSHRLFHTVDTSGAGPNTSQCPTVIMCDSVKEARKRKVDFIVTSCVKNWRCWPTPGYKKWQADLVITGEAANPDDGNERQGDYTVYSYGFTNERQMQGTIYGIFNSQYLINHVADDVAGEVVEQIQEKFSEEVEEYVEKCKEEQKTDGQVL